MKFTILFALFFSFIFIACQEKKVEPVVVGEMSEYKDPAYGFHIQYPKDWKQLGTTGRALFARSQEVANKFQEPSTGEEGGQVSVSVVQYEGKSAPEIIEAGKEELKQIAQLQSDQVISVGGKDATKVPYSIQVTSKKSIVGYEIYVPGDTAMYKLDFAGFGQDQANAHNGLFDAMLKSFQLPVIQAKESDEWAPSTTTETLNSPYFTLQYPDNMNFVSAKKGNNDYVVELRADRLDCSVHLDVFGAKALTVEKVWEQNKGKYKARASGETTIDGNKAFWVDYSVMANISSRAYFVVKNDKVIRTTLNWFAPQKDIYFTAFESMVKSIKLK